MKSRESQTLLPVANPDATPTPHSSSGHLMRLIGSSADLTWSTPIAWYQALYLEFKFTLDPCSTHENAKCPRHYTPADDGLAQSWAEERVFMNPPYGRELPKWMRKAYEAARDHGALVVCFVPARVGVCAWIRL